MAVPREQRSCTRAYQPAMTPLSPEGQQEQIYLHGYDCVSMGFAPSPRTEQVAPSVSDDRQLETKPSRKTKTKRGRPPRLPPRKESVKECCEPSATGKVDQASPGEETWVESSSRAPGSLTQNCSIVDDRAMDDTTVAVVEPSDLATLMLAPTGLPLKKVTLEGFAIPITLRLLEPRSSVLSLTWLEGDTHGFELGELTAIEGLEASDPYLFSKDVRRPLPILPSKRTGNYSNGVSKDQSSCLKGSGTASGGCMRDCCDSRFLILRWKLFEAEVVLEAVSGQQRDLLRRCLEQLVSGVPYVGGPPKIASLDGADRSRPANGKNEVKKQEGQARDPIRSSPSFPENKTPGAVKNDINKLFRLKRSSSSAAPETASFSDRPRRNTEPYIVGEPNLEPCKKRMAELTARLLAEYDRASDESRAAAWRLGATRLRRFLYKAASRRTATCWARWCEVVRKANEGRQDDDRRRWFLHARANRDNDLLAWYHSTFCPEVYRRRVPFWYRETRLQSYQKTYRLVDNGPDSYTPMEKSIMTSCVCTVGTRYPDVAAQIFTAKEVLTPEEYRVFQTLVKRGVVVYKAAPKSGKRAPHPMKVRLWFDRGALCLTSKRERPNRAYSSDHSFYLSKVKICQLAPGRAAAKAAKAAKAASAAAAVAAKAVAAAAETAAAAWASAGSGAVTEASGDAGQDSRQSREDRDRPSGSPGAAQPRAGTGSLSRAWGGAWALTWASGREGGHAIGEGRESKTPVDEGDSHHPLIIPRHFDHGSGLEGACDGGLAGAQYAPGSRDSVSSSGSAALSSLRGGRGDEADRGAGGGNAGAWEVASDASSEMAAPPFDGMVASAPRRVLSIHVFERSLPLQLWFGEEAEGVIWQRMLTKLAWKEQGYLNFSTSWEDPAGTGVEIDGEDVGQYRSNRHHEEEASVTTTPFFYSGCSDASESTPRDNERHNEGVDEDREHRNHNPDPDPDSYPASADSSRADVAPVGSGGGRRQRDKYEGGGGGRARGDGDGGDVVRRGSSASSSPVPTGTKSCSPSSSAIGSATAKRTCET